MSKAHALRLGLLFFLILFIFPIWHFKITPFYEFSLKFNDTNYLLNKKTPSEQVVTLLVDEKSINKYGRWPWDRAVFAEGIQKLAQAKAVALDIVFSEKSTEISDKKLANTISEMDNVIGGFFLRQYATEKQTASDIDTLSNSALERVKDAQHFYEIANAEINIKPILEAVKLSACFSTSPDKDQLFRRYPLAFIYEKNIYPSLSVQTLRLTQNQDMETNSTRLGNTAQIGEKKIFFDDTGFAKLNYYPLSSYKSISFADVMSGKIAPEFFKDKIVIVGISESGISDIRATPLGQIPGPILHATFISNYLQGDLLKSYEKLEPITILLFLLTPFLLTFFIKKISIRIAVYVISYAAFFIGLKSLYLHHNIWFDGFYPLIALIASAALNEFLTFRIEEDKARFIKSAFSSYLSPQLLDALVQNPDKLSLGGEAKEITIFFSDIRNFTTISESLTPTALVALLNRYFTPMTDIVLKSGGLLDKYIGDAIMAFFNAPVAVNDHPARTCKMALEMIAKLKELNIELQKEGLPLINIGAGINTGQAVVGNMGSEDHFNYTAIGDSVNLASRLEGLNKTYGTSIIISEFTKAHLDDTFLTRKLESVLVKGKTIPVTIYELLDNNEQNRKMVEYFETAVAAKESGDIQRAINILGECHRMCNDKASELMIARIQSK
ncbi:MAG: CHASE2 domain-containing protein [Campylobacterales bacterium]